MARDDSLDSSWVDLSEETIGTEDRRHSGGSDIEVESEISDSGNRVVPAISLSSEAMYHDDLSLENHILANTNQNLESLIITRDAKTLSGISRIQALINTLNDAMNENNFKKLDEVVENIKSYEDSFVADLDVESFKNFCIDYLSLKLEDQRVESFEERQSRGDHSYIFSNVLSRRYDIEKNNCNYSAKELLLLAIAANDKLAEKYQDILFAEGNLGLLPLLIGSQKYIAAFIERFPDLYIELKDQVVQLDELNKIGFFSVIALRKEQNLLDTVLIEYVLKDLEQVLQTSSFNPLYGVLETASLVQNEEFIKKVLDVVEGDIKFFFNDLTRKTLLKNSFITLLETAISQEHVSIVEYLCRERIEKKDPIIQKIYKEAFADEEIAAQIDKQILKNIHGAGVERKEKKQKIYDLILKAALHTGSTDSIIKVLDLIKNDPKFLGDTDRQTFLQNSLVTILDNVIREKHFSIIQNMYTNFILKLAENSGVEFLTIQQRYQNACHISISVDNNVAVQFNEEPNGDDSNLEQNEFETTDIQEEQGPSVLGSNRTEIAEFSQEKLLEIINFVKVGYYVGDYNLNNKKFSELEERSYRVPAKLKEEGYKIIQFYNMRDNEQPYRHAGYVFIKDKEITIVYRGSSNWFDYMKDAEMILTSSGELLPEGGKIHSGFYSLFKDSWESVYKILKGYANDQQLEIKDFKINLTGHSMGGAIATIAALCLSVREGAEDLHVATFASPRVFDSAAAKVYEELLGKKTIRVVNQSDFIPSLPLGSMGYKHVGEQLRISSGSSLYVHRLDVYRNLIANLEPDQFKSDNNVSIYYYPSYLAKVLYNVFTAPGYLIPNTHSNGDKQYFKQVKNKHKGASLSEMMKYSGSSNEQKVVIYEDSEPGEGGFIIFHTLDNLLAMMLSLPRHGRGEGLKVNVPDIAFFVNNNYYLSGDTISLRLLKTLVGNYPGSLALMKKEKKSNKLNGGSSSTAAISTLAIAEVSSTNSSLGDHSNSNVQISVQSDENQQMNAEKAGSSNTPGIPELNAGISQVVVSTSTGSCVSLDFNDVSSEELAAQTAQDTPLRDGVTKNDNVVASVSSNDNHSDSSKIQLDESRTGSDQVSNQSTGHITKMDNERAPLSEGNSELESNQQNLQPEVLPIVLNGNPNNIAVTNGNIKMPILEQKSDIKTNGKQSTNPNNGGVAAPSVQLAAPKSVDKNSGKKDTQPKLIPTGIPLVASKDSNRVSNAQGNSKQPSYPGKNNPAPQNAKSKLPVIAASMLAITGVATGIAIAVYLEMLMVGIAVGACCLVAAAIIYYCNKPSNSLEGSSIDKFTDGACCTTVN